jgi:hypothetical protein
VNESEADSEFDRLSERLAEGISEYLVSGPHFYKQQEPDPNDPKLREEPGPSPRLQATLKWEDQTEDGEDIGPLIVYDPDAKEVVWESGNWLRLTEARQLAQTKGWRFGIDGSSTE